MVCLDGVWLYAVEKLGIGAPERRLVEASTSSFHPWWTAAERGGSSDDFENKLVWTTDLKAFRAALTCSLSRRCGVKGEDGGSGSEHCRAGMQRGYRLASELSHLLHLPLPRPPLPELQIKQRIVSDERFGRLRSNTGFMWICRQTPTSPSSTTRREALLSLPYADKAVATGGGQGISGDVAGQFRNRLCFCVLSWGPECKTGGLACNFFVLCGPLCSVIILLLT